MDDVLLGIVLERLDLTPLPEEAVGLLLAALDSDQALSAQLSADLARRQLPAEPAPVPRAPAGAYLHSLTVRGFRGIGSAATLQVAPGPGLTLVLGRNGSGKSSFAEALEVLLTGVLARYAHPAPAVIRDGWQNKHMADSAELRAEYLIEGSGTATLVRTWETGADLAESADWLQRPGKKRGHIEDLGWADALVEYRPFLSPTELEAFFFGRPSELYDMLASVLGLDDLADASSRLNAARKEREDALALVRQRLEPLRVRLGELDDERARACLTALAGPNWDITSAKSAATGADVPDNGELVMLRRLTQVSVPAGAEVNQAVAALREAAIGQQNVAGTAAGQAHVLVRLLGAALDHQQSHGDGDCPVCGRAGALTAPWRSATEEHLARLRDEAVAVEAASAESAAAVAQALALIQPPPPMLSEATVAGVEVRQTQEAWSRWAKRPSGATESDPGALRALADHLELTRPALASAVSELSAQASREVDRRDDRWAPLAVDVASWCADAEPACEAIRPVASIKAARTWLTSATAEIRESRLAPLANQARAIWAMLRQESNVDLGHSA